ncbi:MAG: hypothetical protein JWM36_4694 [Hyphomicrobiales bacterium]|nr:hypothetical protein [Hyphomicrobiales bacterium]
MSDPSHNLSAAAEYRIVPARGTGTMGTEMLGSSPRSNPVQSRRWSIRGVATILFCLGLPGGAYAAITHAPQIVRRIPVSAGLFALAGYSVNRTGLEFKSVTSRLLEDGDICILAVEGTVANIEGQTRTVPDLRLVIMAGASQELYSWTVPSPKARLAAGESVLFRARLVAPPAASERIKVTFSGASDTSGRLKGPR